MIEQGLASTDEKVVRVCIDALVEALSTGHFHRMGGVEAQGGGVPRKDWVPATGLDVQSYWKRVLQLLRRFLVQPDDLGEAVRRGVAERARGLILEGCIDLVEEMAILLVHEAGLQWPEMLDALRTAENYDGKRYSHEVRTKLEALVLRLEPNTLADRLRWIVSTPSWNELRKDESGGITVVAEERATALAEELAAAPAALIDVLSLEKRIQLVHFPL